ncbi:hypothetical protein F5Y18DRAFT_381586, partial [Xylariaceae sp. FL1019]
MTMATFNHTGTASADGPSKTHDISPFASPSFKVYFSDEPALTVPSVLLDQNPQLLRQNNPIMKITSAVGHIIFYFLLTSKYRCLQPRGDSLEDQVSDELRTAVRVFNAARTYNLAGLERLAQGEIENLAGQVGPKQTVSLFRRENLDLRYKDTWAEELFRLISKKSKAAEPDQHAAVEDSNDSWSLGDLVLSALSAELKLDDSSVPSNEIDDVAVPSEEEEPHITEDTVEAPIASPAVNVEDWGSWGRFQAPKQQGSQAVAEAEEQAAREAEIAEETAEIESLKSKQRLRKKSKKYKWTTANQSRLDELIAKSGARAITMGLHNGNAHAAPEAEEQTAPEPGLGPTEDGFEGGWGIPYQGLSSSNSS